MTLMTFYQELIAEIKKQPIPKKGWAEVKRELAIKHKQARIPSNINILMHAPEKEIPLLIKKLLTKPTRTISGVTPVALMTSPAKCPHGKCTYCPGGIGSQWGDVPQSYTGHEPATMRGIRNNYEPYLQVFNRLQQFVLLGQSIDKIEIIIMGGTFTARSKEYQELFVQDIYKALNDFSDLFYGKIDNLSDFNYLKFKEFFELPGDIHDKEREKSIKQKLYKQKGNKTTNSESEQKIYYENKKKITNEKTTNLENNKQKNKAQITRLETEQLKNETSKIRCVALCIETKPDWGLLEQGNEMLRLGCTRVELGIQSVYDDVLKAVNRGHDTSISKKSIQILRDLGFKINFHYMPGLPLTDKERDIAGMKLLFTDQAYKPDMIKFYPCMVAEQTPLYKQWKAGEFTPITTEQAAERIAEIKKIIPEYCRIQRVQRDVPTKQWKAGVDKTNLRQHINQKYPVICRCIRCREPKNRQIDWDSVNIKVIEYEASEGKEFFISAEDQKNDIIIGFCRLRIPSTSLRDEITEKSALIRELHVYGTATSIGEEGEIQHKGWGKKLMQEAENIAIRQDKNKIVVISGVGVREYYHKLGYKKEGIYMVKLLSKI